MNDMRDNAAMIIRIDPTIPVIADADTEYGGESRFSNALFVCSLLTEAPKSSDGWSHNRRLVSKYYTSHPRQP
jgi:hypothetical protein